MPFSCHLRLVPRAAVDSILFFRLLLSSAVSQISDSNNTRSRVQSSPEFAGRMIGRLDRGGIFFPYYNVSCLLAVQNPLLSPSEMVPLLTLCEFFNIWMVKWVQWMAQLVWLLNLLLPFYKRLYMAHPSVHAFLPMTNR